MVAYDVTNQEIKEYFPMSPENQVDTEFISKSAISINNFNLQYHWYSRKYALKYNLNDLFEKIYNNPKISEVFEINKKIRKSKYNSPEYRKLENNRTEILEGLAYEYDLEYEKALKKYNEDFTKLELILGSIGLFFTLLFILAIVMFVVKSAKNKNMLKYSFLIIILTIASVSLSYFPLTFELKMTLIQTNSSLAIKYILIFLWTPVIFAWNNYLLKRDKIDSQFLIFQYALIGFHVLWFYSLKLMGGEGRVDILLLPITLALGYIANLGVLIHKKSKQIKNHKNS